MRKFLFIFCALVLAACNPVANYNAGDEKIAEFQEAYSRGDGDALFAMTGPQFREITTREQFDELLAIFDARLGPVESSERAGFNVTTNTGGTFTVVQMQTEFEQGPGMETYTFLGNGEDMQLVGWNVESQRLLITADDLAGAPEQQTADTELEPKP